MGAWARTGSRPAGPKGRVQGGGEEGVPGDGSVEPCRIRGLALEPGWRVLSAFLHLLILE